jgi:hypothetical protein
VADEPTLLRSAHGLEAAMAAVAASAAAAPDGQAS